jgi:hypothetical protein
MAHKKEGGRIAPPDVRIGLNDVAGNSAAGSRVNPQTSVTSAQCLITALANHTLTHPARNGAAAVMERLDQSTLIAKML